jgi:hypothetical protein
MTQGGGGRSNKKIANRLVVASCSAMLAGVLAGNVWEAYRRANRRTGYPLPKGQADFLQKIRPWGEPA